MYCVGKQDSSINLTSICYSLLNVLFPPLNMVENALPNFYWQNLALRMPTELLFLLSLNQILNCSAVCNRLCLLYHQLIVYCSLPDVYQWTVADLVNALLLKIPTHKIEGFTKIFQVIVAFVKCVLFDL